MATKKVNTQKSDDNLAYLLAYLFEWLTGVIIYATASPSDKRLRMHALQAIALGIISIVASFILDFIFLPIAGLVVFLIWLYGMYIGYEAYKGIDIKIPVISDYIK